MDTEENTTQQNASMPSFLSSILSSTFGSRGLPSSNSPHNIIAILIPLPSDRAVQDSTSNEENDAEEQTEENEEETQLSSTEETSTDIVPALNSSSTTAPNRRRRGVLVLIVSSGSPSGSTGGSNWSLPSEEDSFHELLNRLMQLHVPQGPPPASKNALESLPIVRIDQQIKEEAIRCSVCLEDYEVEDNEHSHNEEDENEDEKDSSQLVVRLPCKHVLHKDCVTTWLQQHNTCPVCRYELPVEDTEYERERQKRMASRTDVDELSFFGDLSPSTPAESSLPELVDDETSPMEEDNEEDEEEQDEEEEDEEDSNNEIELDLNSIMQLVHNLSNGNLAQLLSQANSTLNSFNDTTASIDRSADGSNVDNGVIVEESVAASTEPELFPLEAEEEDEEIEETSSEEVKNEISTESSLNIPAVVETAAKEAVAPTASPVSPKPQQPERRGILSTVGHWMRRTVQQFSCSTAGRR